MRPTQRNALIQSVRVPTERECWETRAAGIGAKSGWRILCETGVAVAAEERIFLIEKVIPTCIPLIGSDDVGSAGRVIITKRRALCIRIGQREELQKRLSLRA